MNFLFFGLCFLSFIYWIEASGFSFLFANNSEKDFKERSYKEFKSGINEFIVYCDTTFLEANKGDKERAKRTISSIFYYANNYWGKFNVRNVFEHDKVKFLEGSKDIFLGMRNYTAMHIKMRDKLPLGDYDSKALLVASYEVEFIRELSGIGSYDDICKGSAILVMYRGDTEASGLSMAHEIGHIFGLKHVEDYKPQKCVCVDMISNYIDFCVMNSQIDISQVKHTWSNCSVERFKSQAEIRNLECLKENAVIPNNTVNPFFPDEEFNFFKYFPFIISGLVVLSLIFSICCRRMRVYHVYPTQTSHGNYPTTVQGAYLLPEHYQTVLERPGSQERLREKT